MIRSSLYDKLNQFSFKVGISEIAVQTITHKQNVEEQAYNFTFVKSTPLDVLNKLRNQEIELGITSNKVDDPQFERTFLFQTEVLIATSCTLISNHVLVGTAQTLENVPFLILEDHVEHETLTKMVTNVLKITPTFIYCADSLGIHKWLCANKGVLVIHSTEKELLEDETIRFLSLENQIYIDYYLYKNKSYPFTFNVEGAKNYLKSACNKM